MSLTNIEYGSLASSEVLNNNFLYLDNRITESINNINTSIASMLSNIATMNTSFNGLSDSVTDSIQSLSTNFSTSKAALRTMINDSVMLPNWSGLTSINLSPRYTATSNGYILGLPSPSGKGNLTVNGVTVNLKYWDQGIDYASELITIPVKKDDVITSTVSFRRTYFLPVMEMNFE